MVRLRDGFAIVAKDAHKKTPGELTLTFSDAPLRLQGWTITDAQGQSTRVRLESFGPSGPFEKSLFEVKDPRMRYQAHP